MIPTAGEWVGLITQGGVIAVLVVWIFELRSTIKDQREDLKNLHAERLVLLERVIKGLGDSATAVGAVTESVNTTNSVMTSLKDVIIVKGVVGGTE